MGDCNDNCQMIPRIEALEEANRKHAETHQRIFDRMDAINRETGEQAVMLKTIDDKLDKLILWQEDNRDRLAKIESIGDLNEKVSALESKPAKRWEGAVDKVIHTVIGAVIAYFLIKMGLPV